ncbi:hypothetical protein DYE50_08300 [Treponema ruminis]|uniref:Cadherin domain-containing protein n=1 Tax=Treponema ruminis TaxID=744515 RepID=A0A7W8GBL2_9SPIR|nr:hypothetical protein [Treponema ruminis]MBB5227445.1 hypothetical protein [Treponema ruminis]QSI02565.1 hypothetical protein DYE50_08300 [Treponema ruminis]
MKKVFLNVWKKALVLSLAVIPFVITACGEDSGLGSTVDTEAPKIEITYPPLGANIRGTFVLAGNCDDDKSVKSIIVTVTDTTTKKVVGTVPASIENEGKSWKASINNYNDKDKKYDYLDGNYQFTAEVHDGAGHKSNASRVFDLDNTAPVFVASNPGVIKSQGKKASAYGSIFTIDGTIADDHTIASLTAKIFDENGTLIGDYKEEDIATAGGTSVTIASHYVDKNDGTARTVQNERYTQIYGDNDAAGTKKYYCTVLVEDNTKSYTDPGESDNTTSGNITSKVYLYDSVYKSLMSSKSGNRYGLSAADFMTLLNGTRAADEKTEPALKILKEVVVDTSAEAEDKDANKLSFSLNPMANPTYSVNGFSVSKDIAGNVTYKEAFSDSTVVVSVNAGLDKTAILPGNLKVWTVLVDGLTPEKALERVSKVASKITAVQKLHYEEVLEKSEEIINEVMKYAEAEKLDIVLVKDNSTDSGSSVQTETLSCVLPKEAYISGKVYAFIVTGYDEDDVAFLQNTLYAFKANEAGQAPTLIITEPENQSYLKSTEGLVFSGKTSLPDGSTLKVAALIINLRVQDENKQNIAVGKTDGYTVDLTYNETSGYSSTDESLTYDPSTKIWTFTPSKLADYNDISASEGEGKSYFYTVDISSESSSRNATSKTISVHVDSTMPKVSIANVTPYVSGSNFYSEAGENIRNYVNGDITVKFNIEETNLKEVSYKVLVDGEEKVSPVSLGKVYSGSIDLDTTKWTETAKEKKNIEVVITAVDVCGNTTSYSTTEYNTVTYKNDKNEEVNFNKPIIICQETDIPQIKFANAELSYKTGKDDQIVEHSFLVVEEEAKNDANKKSIVASHNLFNIKNNNTIQIALDDDDNIASAKVVLYDEAGKLYEADGFENPSIKQIGKPSFTWNYLLPAKEGIYQVYIEVTDSKLKDDLSETVKLWRTNKVGKFYVAVDDGAPTVEIKNPVAGSYQKKAFAANGTVSEKDNVTLTRSIYKLDAKAEDKKSVDITAKITKDKDGNFIWAETDEDIKDLADGEYILSYTATDRYEQSYTSDVRVKVDTKAPVFKDDKSKVFVSSNAEAGKAYVEKTWFNSEALNLSGEFEEANGISNVYYWLDTDVNTVEKDGKTQIVFSDILNEDKTVKTKGASGSFTAVTENGISTYKTTIPDFTECSAANAHKLTLIAVDLAGNESEKIEYTSIKVDMTAPVFENYYYKMGAVKGEVSGNILTNGENDVILYGLISDAASGVDVNNFVLNVINGTTKSILADTQTVKNITFTTEPTSWTEVDGENQQTVNVDTTAGFEKWIEKADAATATTFKDGASIEDTTKITGWKAVIDNDRFKAGEVRTNYFDNAGNGNKNYKMFSIRVDKEKPKISNHTLTAEKKTGEIIDYTAYKTADYTFPAGSDTKIPHYYVNNSDGHTFSLSGVATDNEGIAKVELITGSGVTKDADKGEFKWTGIDLSALDADSNVTIKITDIANNVFEQNIHITPDVKAPEGKHSTGNVDNYFRIGDSKVGEVSDVGLGQSAETYGKDSSLKIRGYFTENGSGLNMIYYKTFASIPSATDIDEFKKDYEGKKSGYFSPLEVEESRTIGQEVIPTNFKTNIPGFKEGKNYLVLIAVDKVGNAELDNVTYKYTPDGTTSEISLAGCYEIKVDMTQPRFERFYYKMGAINAEVKGDILTNGENNVTLYGLISDADSGVDVEKLQLKVLTDTEKKVIADTSNITFTTEATSWTAGSVQYTMASSNGLEKWVEKADKDGESTFKAASSISDTTKITGWKAVINKKAFETGEVRADYYDKAGNSSLNIKMFSVRVDKKPPKLNNHNFADTTPNYTAYKSKTVIEGTGDDAKSVPYYFIHNTDDHKFTLSGVATDNEGVARVELKNGTSVLKHAEKGDFNFDDLDFSTLSAVTTLTLSITDAANNVSDYKIVLTPDVTAPNGIHDTDSLGKDLQFRIGEQVYGSEKVGAKYSKGTYGNSNSIMIRGYFDEAETGSGLSMIYYMLKQTPPSVDDITGTTGFLKNYQDKATGYFAPTEKTSQTILKNVGTGASATQEKVTVAYNFKTLLSGFQEGNNYLVLVAVDNVGNAAVDTKTFSYKANSTDTEDTVVNCYSINVDTAVPELSDQVTVEIAGSSDGLSASQILTNFKKGDITLKGFCSDAAAGIDSVTLYVEGKGKNSTDAEVVIDKTTSVTVGTTSVTSSVEADLTGATEQAETWSGKVAANLFSNVESGTFAVYATVKDKAGDGNTINRSVATIIVDKTNPGVTLKAPADADSSTTDVEINGIISLSGEITDGNILPDKAITAIQYVVKPATDPEDLNTLSWTDASSSTMTGFDLSGNYTFTASNFDTSKLTDKTVYYIRAKATDKAGNVGYSAPVTVTVDQDTDRPVIKITSLDKAGDIISAGTIMGTISDDDGIDADSFKYKDGETGEPKDFTSFNSGNWRIDGLEAGERNIFFVVTDKAGTTFETKKTTKDSFASSGEPYVILEKTPKALNTDAVSFKVDLKDPKITALYFASTEANAIPAYPNTAASEPWQPTGKVSYGPASKFMSIYFTVEEDVEMAAVGSDVEIKAPNGTISLDEGKVTRIDPEGATTDYIYKIGVIDTTGGFQTLVSEGNNTITITVTDKSGRKSSETFNIFVDNVAPTVKNFYNDTETGITGKVTIPGSVTDSTGIKTVKYLIPTAEQQTTYENDRTTDEKTAVTNLAAVSGWKDISVASSMYAEFDIKFESSSFTEETNATTGKTSLIYYASKESSTAGKLEYAVTRSGTGTTEDPYTYAQASTTDATIYVPIFFYTEDSNGSKGITKFYYRVYPDGGIPKAELTSHAESVNGLVKTGNKVNLMGTAEDDEGVASVKITKLEYTTEDGDSITDSTTWKEIDISNLSSDSSDTNRAVTRGTVEGSTIVCDGTTSWKASINTAKINTGTDELKAIRVTVEAFDENDTSSSKAHANGTSATCINRIVVDKTVPVLESAAIVGFASAPASVTATPVFEKSYEAGMYFSGTKATNWYLKAEISDDSSVTGFEISSMTGSGYISAISDGGVDSGDSTLTAITGLVENGRDTKTYTILIPITTSSEGHVYATLEMFDGQHTDVTTAFSFFIDNTAPALYKTKAGTAGVADDKLAHADTLRLKSNGMQIDTGNNVVENSDGSYTFGDELVEARSGLAYVAFYFKKAASETHHTTNRIYSPMFGTDNMITLAASKTADEVYINSEGLPALVKTVTVTNTTTDGVTTSTVKFTRLGTNKFINNAAWNTGATSFGLVKIGGAYHRIKSITDDVATLADEVSDKYTEAEFIYAMLVDHQIAEGFSSADPTGVSNDDGDGLVEMVKQTGSTYKWTASIHSDNIPDGPAEIHIVVFDDAGNSNSGYVKTSIQNNRPRIARVYLATDLNGNNLFDFDNGEVPELDSNSERYTENGTEYGELAYYSTLTKDSKIQATATLKKNQCNFVVSNRLLVLPEIIGGNGEDAELRYAYSVSDNSPEALTPEDAEAESVGITQATGTALKSFSSSLAALQLADRGSTAASPVTTNISSFLGSRTPTDANGYFVKNGTVPTNNRGYLGFVLNNDDLKTHESWVGDTKIKKYFAFTIWDKTPETTQGEDSLYALLKIPLVINVKDDVRPRADITPFYWNSKEDGSFVYAEDGTPEGHIDLVAEADKNKTTVRPGVSGTVYIEGTAYDETRLSKIEVRDPSGTAYTIAEYDSGAWKTAENATEAGTNGWPWPDNYISSKVETITEPSQKGHKVAWKLEINMTKFGIKTDQSVYVTAYDASTIPTGKNSSINSSVQTVCDAHTSRYRMDFVPYIKSIYPATESSAARSRLGKFPVQAGKDMYIEGMNFSTDLEYRIGFSTTPENEALISSPNTYEGKFIEDDDVSKVENGKIKVTAPQNSCYVRVWVKPTGGNWTYTKNNMNENAGCNIEEGYVASDDNGKGNMDRGFKRANDAGTNFWTDDRYIAVWNTGTKFDNSDNPRSGTLVKYEKDGWQTRGGSLPDDTYSKQDRLFGFWGSTHEVVYDAFLGTSASTSMCRAATGTFYTPTEYTDVCLVWNAPSVNPKTANQATDTKNRAAYIPFYVFLENGCSLGETWGTGLTITRDGYKLDKNLHNEQGVTIEYQGDDSMMDQFRNPKMVGVYSSETEKFGDDSITGLYHFYITYYDAYTHCLKYAAVDYPAYFADSKQNYQRATFKMSANSKTPTYKIGEFGPSDAVIAGNDSVGSGHDTGMWSDVALIYDRTTAVAQGEITAPTPVVAYYDKTDKTLHIAVGNSSIPKTASGWTDNKITRPSGLSDFGRYVTVEMDDNNGLHVVAQGTKNNKGALYYMYFEANKYDKPAITTVVDSTDNVGVWCEMTLNDKSKTGLEALPVITHMAQGSARVAKVAYIEDGHFESISDPSDAEPTDYKLSVVTDAYEGVVSAGGKTGNNTKSPYAIGINSDYFYVDFLRGEE